MPLATSDEIRVVLLENFHAALLKWVDSRSFDHQSRKVIKDEIARLEAEQAE